MAQVKIARYRLDGTGNNGTSLVEVYSKLDLKLYLNFKLMITFILCF